MQILRHEPLSLRFLLIMAGTARASRQPNQRLQRTGVRHFRRPPHGFRLTAMASCDLLAGTPAAEALVVRRLRRRRWGGTCGGDRRDAGLHPSDRRSALSRGVPTLAARPRYST